VADTVLDPLDWESHPPYLYPPYRSTVKRGPTQPLIALKDHLRNLRAPVYGADDLGRVLDERARPVANTLVEIWQANAAGRYVHKTDQHDAPLDPNFLGAGRCLTDAQGRYRFLSIKPGAYPWGNHDNAWRPNHIHFSLFGEYFASRLITQMYFPGDPLLAYDPMFQGVPAAARDRLVANFKLDVTQPGYALGYEFDIVLRGANETPREK